MTHTPRTAEQIRAALQQAARDNDGAIVEDKTRWAVIAEMEAAWRDEPGKVRTANRRTVTKWLLGHASTKQLSDAHIRALADWLHDFDFWSDLRLCLRQALIEAGQMQFAADRQHELREDGLRDAEEQRESRQP